MTDSSACTSDSLSVHDASAHTHMLYTTQVSNKVVPGDVYHLTDLFLHLYTFKSRLNSFHSCETCYLLLLWSSSLSHGQHAPGKRWECHLCKVASNTV